MALTYVALILVSLVSAPEPGEAALLFFEHLAAGDGVRAASMCSDRALTNVAPMLEDLKEGLDSGDGELLERLRSCGYTASPDEMLDWSEEDYLASTLSLPMVSVRYSRYDTAYVCSTWVADSRGEVFLCLEAGSSSAVRAPVSLTRERGSWKVLDFMGMYSFP